MKHLRVRSILVVAAIAALASSPVFAESLPDDMDPHIQLVQSLQDESTWRTLLPAVSNTPVFELDCDGRTVYTLDSVEKKNLIDQGWTYKGPAFYSCEPDEVPVYRLHDNDLNFVYSLEDSIPGYTLDGPAFFVQNAASLSHTITLEKDLTQTFTVQKGQNVTINLNGHSIRPATGPAIIVNKGGTLTINGDGNLSASGTEPVVRNNGNVVINGGHYENDGNYCVINHGNMIINGGEFTHTNRNCVSSLIDNGYYNYDSGNALIGYVAGCNYASPMMTINGGDFHGGRWLIKSDDNGVATSPAVTSTTPSTVSSRTGVRWN